MTIEKESRCALYTQLIHFAVLLSTVTEYAIDLTSNTSARVMSKKDFILQPSNLKNPLFLKNSKSVKILISFLIKIYLDKFYI